MKKKQIITMVIMAVMLVGMIAGYSVFQKYQDEKLAKEIEQEANIDTIPLFEMNSDDITEVVYTLNGETVDMVLNDGIWMMKDTDRPMNSSYLEDVKGAMSSVVAIRVITEEAEDLKEYGLDDASNNLKYTVTSSDGSSHTLRFGINVPTEETAYYAMVDDDKKVYAMSSNYYDILRYSLSEMTEIVDDISITAEYITEVDVTSKENGKFSARYFGDEVEKGYYCWEITNPYKDVLADTDKWKLMLNQYGSMKLEECVSFGVTDYSEYGLEKPNATIRLKYYNVTGVEDADNGDMTDASGNAASATPVPEEKREYDEMILYMSEPQINEDGETFFYVRLEGSSNVYTMDADAQGLYAFTPFEVADVCIYSKLVDEIKGFDVEFEDTKLVFERRDEKPTATPEPNAIPKKKDTINVYYVNGKKVNEEDALNLYSFAYLLTYSGEADKNKEDVSDVPALTIIYHPVEGEDVVVKYLPYDGTNFYHVDKNGMNYFLTDKRGIDTLISNYKEFIKNNSL